MKTRRKYFFVEQSQEIANRAAEERHGPVRYSLKGKLNLVTAGQRFKHLSANHFAIEQSDENRRANQVDY